MREVKGTVQMRWKIRGLVILLALGLFSTWPNRARASDPRNPPHEFVYSLYPPENFSVKKSKAVVRADPKQPKAHPLIGADGKFTALGQWYYDIGSDPKCFETWWRGYFADPNVWKPSKTPAWTGTGATNQGHRIIAWLGTFRKLIEANKEIDPAVKAALMTEEWKRSAEQVIGSMINERGLMHHGDNIADMACHFHFIRTKFGAIGLRLDRIYTIERAQDYVVTLLTEPWIVNPEDRYVEVPDPEYLESVIGKQKGGIDKDVRLVKDGKLLWTGGLFIGWKDKPSLHGTWDALSILNGFFKYYPDPDPASPKCIFYKWNKLPADKRQIGVKAITLCSRRLWLDWKENGGKTWCWVRDGRPTDDDSKPSEAPILLAYDGYGDNQFGWAKQCWDEMFGDPMRNTNDGVQALLAIAHGKVHRDLKTPVGQQVPGRYDYDAETQKRLLEEDLKRLGRLPSATRPSTADEAPKLKPEPKDRPGSKD